MGDSLVFLHLNGLWYLLPDITAKFRFNLRVHSAFSFYPFPKSAYRVSFSSPPLIYLARRYLVESLEVELCHALQVLASTRIGLHSLTTIFHASWTTVKTTRASLPSTNTINSIDLFISNKTITSKLVTNRCTDCKLIVPSEKDNRCI